MLLCIAISENKENRAKLRKIEIAGKENLGKGVGKYGRLKPVTQTTAME